MEKDCSLAGKRQGVDGAEQLGHLPWAMSALASAIENKRMARFRFLAEFFKPVVICLLGLVVLFFAIGMFMPLVQLLNDLT